MPSKLTYKYVKEYIENRDYILDQNFYVNNWNKLKLICPNGHKFKTIFNSFQQNLRCPICRLDNLSKKFRHSLEYVKNYIENKNYKLNQDFYINNRTKLKLICPENHNFNMAFSNFQQNQRCPICSNINKSKKMSGCNNHRWNNDREKINRNNQLRRKCKSLLRRCLDKIKNSKTLKTSELLGYTNKQLLEHLESFPNWNEIKEQNWHLDHIIPVKAFIDNDISDLKIINHLSNLQPLLAKDNIKKHAKYLQEDFDNYIKKFKS